VTNAEPGPVARGLLDTSVVIDIGQVPPGTLPLEPAIAAVTFAELAAGPHATDDPDERARRQDLLQRVEALVDPLPFDAAAARAYGRVYAATRARDRKPRGARAIDLLIAATALSHELPLFTRNPDDFEHLEAVGLQVHPV
jgi:predicted nucleic acid-binding protein